jgi:hypothetical protein
MDAGADDLALACKPIRGRHRISSRSRRELKNVDFLQENSDAVQAMAALVSIAAIVPAAAAFFMNQRAALRDRRESKYIETNNQFQFSPTGIELSKAGCQPVFNSDARR